MREKKNIREYQLSIEFIFRAYYNIIDGENIYINSLFMSRHFNFNSPGRFANKVMFFLFLFCLFILYFHSLVYSVEKNKKL